ncbi:MAG: NCS2 family permease, partial [Clostridia bacterium]
MEEQNKVVAEAQTATTPVNGFDKFFGITKAHGNFKKGVKTEVIAGITTFMTMVYILFVNAGMFAELDGVTYGGTYIATALASIIGTVLIGLLSKLPLAQSVGMGLNAFFVYTIVKFGGTGLSYANALLFVLADGIVFVILTVTGLKKVIFNAIPEAVRKAIPAGIGLFIALIGLQDAGLVVKDPATGVALGSFNLLKGDWGAIMPLICTVLGVIFIAVLSQKKVRGAILWGILGISAMLKHQI